MRAGEGRGGSGRGRVEGIEGGARAETVITCWLDLKVNRTLTTLPDPFYPCGRAPFSKPNTGSKVRLYT